MSGPPYNTMIHEVYTLTYNSVVLLEMSEEHRAIFDGPLKKLVTGTSQRVFFHAGALRYISFHFTAEALVEAVEKWPWLVYSDLGEKV